MSVPDSMQAVRLVTPGRADAPGAVRLEEVATPAPGEGEALVRVEACGLTDVDRAVVRGEVDVEVALPRTPGREGAGVVAATGPTVVDWEPGDRVAVLGSRPCGNCPYCAVGRDNLCVAQRTLGVDVDGCLAGYVVADVRFLVPVPPELPQEQAAIVPYTVARAYHALKRTGAGDGVTIAVHGLDASGLHAVLLARLAGTQVLGVDADAAKRELALELGADEVVDPTEADPARHVHELSEGGVDGAAVFVGGTQAVDRALRSLRAGGRVTVADTARDAIRTVSAARLAADELELVGSGAPTHGDVGELLDLVDDGRLDLGRTVGRRLRLDEVPDALARPGDGAAPATVVAVG